jgi:hypothetical protein
MYGLLRRTGDPIDSNKHTLQLKTPRNFQGWKIAIIRPVNTSGGKKLQKNGESVASRWRLAGLLGACVCGL